MYAGKPGIPVAWNPEVVSCAKMRMCVLGSGMAPVFGRYVRYEIMGDRADMVFEPDGMPGVHGRADAKSCYMLNAETEREVRDEYARQVAELDALKANTPPAIRD